MRRMLWTAGAVVVGDGMLLGASLALGWIVLTVPAVLVGLGGALLVARTVPAPRVPAHPATVTLGVPMRDASAASAPEPATVPVVDSPVADSPVVEVPATITPAPVAA